MVRRFAFFFFQAEGGIRDSSVTGVQTCALPICQDLLNPPDVSGWKGGSTWINSSTLFERFNWGNRLSMGRDSTKPYFTDVAGQIQTRNISSPDGQIGRASCRERG